MSRIQRSSSATSLRRGAKGLRNLPYSRGFETMGMNVWTVSKNFVAMERHWLKSPMRSRTYLGIGTSTRGISICACWKRSESRKKTAGNFGLSIGGAPWGNKPSNDGENGGGMLEFE